MPLLPLPFPSPSTFSAFDYKTMLSRAWYKGAKINHFPLSPHQGILHFLFTCHFLFLIHLFISFGLINVFFPSRRKHTSEPAISLVIFSLFLSITAYCLAYTYLSHNTPFPRHFRLSFSLQILFFFYSPSCKLGIQLVIHHVDRGPDPDLPLIQWKFISILLCFHLEMDMQYSSGGSRT
jgi:hypothetical protein